MENRSGSVILKLSMLALAGGVGLLPTEASAQFGFQIPLPPGINLRLGPPVRSAPPSRRSSPAVKHEQNSGSAPEKDATQEEQNTSAPATHQLQQGSSPMHMDDSPPARPATPQTTAPTPPAFSPSR